jgi:endoglucanase
MRCFKNLHNILFFLAGSASVACSASSPVSKQASSAAAQRPAEAYPKGGELLKRSTFKDPRSVPWLAFFNPPASGDGGTKQGAYCMRIDKLGKNLWDVQFRHREMTIVKDHRYAVRFTAWSSSPIGIRAKVGMSGAPYSDYWSGDFDLTSKHTEFSDAFTCFEPDDPSAEFAFHLNDENAKLPVEICFDELHLTDPDFNPNTARSALKIPAIHVNQLGYFPSEKKRATLVFTGEDAKQRATKPVPFELVDSAGTVLYRGMTEPFGRDATSDVYVQRLEFSSFTDAKKDLKLRIVAQAGSAEPLTSDRFSIDAQLLNPLSRDALRYIYYTRSGIALKQPYVQNSVWERTEGHPTDTQVPCAPDAHCSYSLDVSGGWYDAGDYGKYVVNGGFSVWLLMNLWEVSQQNGWAVAGSNGQDLNIPESGNGIPDLLDEAKWELEWMLKMQVPEGFPQAGLVHHKMHDEDWSALGTMPQLSEKTKRYLRPVSTAATLNLAAVAAQASRVFAKLDPEFSERCRVAARRAWDAAQEHPSLLVTLADNHGGGAYEDASISDERFWAATELYLSTRDARYWSILSQSRHYLAPPAQDAATGVLQAMDWRTTDTLGTLSLALDSKAAPIEARERSMKAIIAIAERFLALSNADGFGQPYAGTHYPWGSNSFILNNGIILAYAHAFTKDRRFLDGAVATMDYILGRNALGKSHVSGYGTRPLTNPHHRLWARAIGPKFPPPPPGVVCGGPNSDLQDPYSKAANLGCVGQTCYVDHIDAYSANEVAINWNAELAWLTAYLNATLAAAR